MDNNRKNLESCHTALHFVAFDVGQILAAIMDLMNRQSFTDAESSKLEEARTNFRQALAQILTIPANDK